MSLARSHWPPDRSVEVIDMTSGRLLVEAAEDTPDSVAIVDGSPSGERRSWTYHELLRAALAMSHELVDEYDAGERIAILAPSCPEWEIFQFAAALAGLVVVTVNPSYRKSELAYVLGQSRCSGIALVDGYRDTNLSSLLNEMKSDLPELRGVHNLVTWHPDPASNDWKPPEVLSDSAAMIHYTSGTTGSPKGAVLSHRALTNNARLFARRFAIARGSVWADALPMFHLSGSGFCAMGAMWTRSSHIIFPFEPGLALRIIETERAAFFPAVPTMLFSMLEHPSFDSTDLSSLEVVMSGGTTIPQVLVRDVEERFGARFGAIYGQTELSGVICQSHPTDSLFDKTERAGQPLEQVEVKIVGTEEEVLPCGRIGQIMVRGFNVMMSYFDEPDKTRATLTDDGWLRTGDLGTMDDRGYVQVTGRLKDMIIRGGENIYPREIEDRLHQLPAIAEVAVVGLADERWGEQVAAFIRLAPGLSLNANEVDALLRRDLASYKVPRIWLQVDAMPLTPSGKIQKFALREGYEDGRYKPLT